MILKKIRKIYELTLQINKYLEYNADYTTGPTVFINFSGHINMFEIRVYKDGWHAGDECTYKDMCYLEDQTAEASLDRMIQYLEGLMYESRCE